MLVISGLGIIVARVCTCACALCRNSKFRLLPRYAGRYPGRSLPLSRSLSTHTHTHSHTLTQCMFCRGTLTYKHAFMSTHTAHNLAFMHPYTRTRPHAHTHTHTRTLTHTHTHTHSFNCTQSCKGPPVCLHHPFHPVTEPTKYVDFSCLVP